MKVSGSGLSIYEEKPYAVSALASNSTAVMKVYILCRSLGRFFIFIHFCGLSPIEKLLLGAIAASLAFDSILTSDGRSDHSWIPMRLSNPHGANERSGKRNPAMAGPLFFLSTGPMISSPSISSILVEQVMAYGLIICNLPTLAPSKEPSAGHYPQLQKYSRSPGLSSANKRAMELRS